MVEDWAHLTPARAINLLETISVKYTNKAADIDAFYNLRQGQYEGNSEYFTRGHAVASNENLHCPGCSQSLGNYLLLSKLAVGIYNEDLRKEVF